jgi:hypothetical protein
MANTASQKYYGQGAVFGSLAYDFNNPDLYADVPLEPAAPEFPRHRPEPRTAPRTAPRTRRQARAEAVSRARAEAAAANRQALAPFTILGGLCVVVLLVFTMLARVQLTAVSEGSAALESQLSDLKVEQNRLLIDYESAFNLTEVEEYAIHVLGMQQPRDDQIYYIDSTAPDKGEVLSGDRSESVDNQESPGILEQFSAYFG